MTAYNVALGTGKNIGGMRHENMLVKGYKNNFETRTLDSFNLEKVDILKIDVEGFECDVVEGAINTISKHKPKIILKMHGSKSRKNV